jgi:hypothetical protein
MKKAHQKGFIVPVLLGIIFILIVGGSIYINDIKKTETPDIRVANTQQPAQVQQTNTQTPAVTQPKVSSVTPSVNTAPTSAKAFLEQMQIQIGTQIEAKPAFGFQDIPGYKVSLPQDKFTKAKIYISSQFGAPSMKYGSERGNGFENWHIVCFDAGLGADPLPTDLPYILCADKVGVQSVDVIVGDIKNIDANSRTFILMLGNENMKVKMPTVVQNTEYAKGTFMEFVKTVSGGKFQTNVFKMDGRVKDGVFEVTQIQWILG